MHPVAHVTIPMPCAALLYKRVYENADVKTKLTTYAIVLIVLSAVVYVAFVVRKNETPERGAMLPSGVNQTQPLLPKSIKDSKTVTDITNVYSVEIPDDWRVEPQIGSGTRPSYLRAESSDWRTETPDSLNASTHIATGASLEVYVFDQDIGGRAPDRLQMTIKLEESRPIKIHGLEQVLNIYREYEPPREGLVLEVPVEQGGNFYTFRFAYNPTTFPEGEAVFVKILHSVIFLQ